jgi:hypothetical protein
MRLLRSERLRLHDLISRFDRQREGCMRGPMCSSTRMAFAVARIGAEPVSTSWNIEAERCAPPVHTALPMAFERAQKRSDATEHIER